MQIQCSESEIYLEFLPLLKKLPPQAILFLQGPLGSGKTTFVREFSRYFLIEEQVQSPTFNLVHIYEVPSNTPAAQKNPNLSSLRRIFHFDLYRLKDSQSVDALLEETLLEEVEDAYLAFFEWPQKVNPALLPVPVFATITLTPKAPQQRKYHIQGNL